MLWGLSLSSLKIPNSWCCISRLPHHEGDLGVAHIFCPRHQPGPTASQAAPGNREGDKRWRRREWARLPPSLPPTCRGGRQPVSHCRLVASLLGLLFSPCGAFPDLLRPSTPLPCSSLAPLPQPLPGSGTPVSPDPLPRKHPASPFSPHPPPSPGRSRLLPEASLLPSPGRRV